MMMVSMGFMVVIMFLVGNLIFVGKSKHLLIILMSLEFLVLGLFFLFLVYLKMIDFGMYMLMCYLVFTVCEGVLGLSILVSLIRTHGSDYFQSFNLI